MLIKDFNKMKIGDKVIYRGKVCTINDIDRRAHTANIGLFKWIRCSEFSDLKTTKTKHKRKVKMILPNGKEKIFKNQVEASKYCGITPEGIRSSCLKHSTSKLIVKFEFVD